MSFITNRASIVDLLESGVFIPTEPDKAYENRDAVC